MSSVALLGAGNVATHLGAALVVNGYRVTGVYSRTAASADRLAGHLGCPGTDCLDRLTPGEWCIFAVKDDALPALAKRWTALHPDTFCLHTAGSVPMDVFAGHADRYGVLYPLQTFSKARAVDFRRVPCFVEANGAPQLETLTALARTLSDRVVALPSERRRYLHLAAVLACNFANHCYDLAARLLEREGLPFDLLLPLIDETAAKVHDLAPREAQTGPAVRYDREVINRQLDLLADRPELRQLYAAMSQSIHQYARQND